VRRRRSPRPLSGALRRVLSATAPATPLAAVQAAWPGVVGEAIAAEATPVSERDGLVMVACRSSTWAEQLDLLHDDLLKRLNGVLPAGRGVRRLRFTASG
jgi:predicted nucleic acid-binding Zn ribbon protein